MTPIIVARAAAEPRVVAGGSGGPLIISATLQTVLGIVDFGLDPAAAIAAPRIHHQWAPPALVTETELDADGRRRPDRAAATRSAACRSRARCRWSSARDGTLIAAADQRKRRRRR